ncbi:DUF406 family protein [Haemophilus influenzae]|uniref:DUF406 family protein n=1 Tax=Haemophilus influenzae TaxID=727 RepID=UPI000E573A40
MGFSPPKYLTIVCWWAKAHPTITEITKVDDGYLLKANFTFCCQAELVIFQMRIA